MDTPRTQYIITCLKDGRLEKMYFTDDAVAYGTWDELMKNPYADPIKLEKLEVLKEN